MTASQVLMIAAAIYIAPHVPPEYGIGIGAVFLLIANLPIK